MKPKNGKHRSYCFTFNNYSDAALGELKTLPCRYMCIGFEIAPSTGTKHLQGFVSFGSPRSQDAVRKLFPWHVEVARGTAAQNRTYCTKGGEYWETGELPSDPATAGHNERERWASSLELAKKGDFENIPADIYIRYRNTLLSIYRDALGSGLEDSTGTHWWYWGETRTGKSRAARAWPGSKYIKGPGKWWDHYAGEDVAILEDFDRRDSDQVRLLKLWCDRYPFRGEYKGGSMMLRPKTVIVTSNYHPNEIWCHLQDLEPILARFEVKEFKRLKENA